MTLGSEHPDAVRTAHWDARPRRRVRGDRRAQRGVGAGARPRRGGRARRGRRGAGGRARAHVERARRRVRARRGARAPRSACSRPRRPSTRSVAVGGSRSRRRAARRWPRGRGRRPARRGTRSRAAERGAGRRAAPHRRPRRARGVRAQPARAGAAARVPHVPRAGARARVRRDGRAARDDGLRSARTCGTTRPLVCLHCHGGTFRAVRPGITRVRDDLAALLPRAEVASVDAATDAVPDVPVLIGTEAVLHRVAVAGGRPGPPVGLVAYLELDQELLAPRARAAEQALWLARPRRPPARRVTPTAAGCSLQTRLPDHEVVQAVRRGDPMLVVARRGAAPRRRSASRPSAGWPSCSGAPEAVAAACAARAPTAGRDRARARWPTGTPSARRCAAAVGRRAVRRAGRARASTPPAPRGACASTSTPAGSDRSVRPRGRAGTLGACIRCASSAIPC